MNQRFVRAVAETIQDQLASDLPAVLFELVQCLPKCGDIRPESLEKGLGGVTIDVPRRGRGKGPVVCGDVDGGKEQGGVSLKLTAGDHTLEGDKALAFARLRHNTCDPSEDDRDRAERQQLVLNGIKGRLTSPLRLPINFIKGPFIGWDAPRAFVSDMGGFTLPQLAIAAIFGGSGDTNVLEPSGPGPGGSLFISEGECNRAVEDLTGGAPKQDPACSPG